jgi:hypothetical protein
MSIDRIGKGGGPPVGDVGKTGSTSATEIGAQKGADFKVAKAEAADAVAKSPLDRLQSGEITVAQYLDIRVAEATSHLDKGMSAEHLSFIRSTLRDQLATDPVLVDLVQQATGALPPRGE